MILRDSTLLARLHEFIRDPDPALVNPASIDLRIGRHLLVESLRGWAEVDLLERSQVDPYWLSPGVFALAETLEWIVVPADCAVELRLKSTLARLGFTHALACWFDPGWSGVGTLEIRNETRYHDLPLWSGQRFVHMMVHCLDGPAEHPYAGRYQGASAVMTPRGDGVWRVHEMEVLHADQTL